MGIDHLAAGLMVPAVAGLLWVKKTERIRLELVVKPLASALFLIVAATQTAVDPRFASWMLAGLVCSFVGDGLLIGKGRWWVGPGLAAFLAAHLCYLVAVAPQAHPAWAAGVGLALAAAGAYAMRGAGPALGRLRGPAFLYLLVLSGITGAAVSVWIRDPGASSGALLGVGMLLFFLSDLSVFKYRFEAEDFRTKLWGTPAYYLAQLLLAFSIGAGGARAA